MQLPKYRYLKKFISEELQEKMVFLGGPRQVGKTTLGFSLLGLTPPNKTHPGYLNWDIVSNKSRILKQQWPLNEKLIVLDEIHKYARWRSLAKGFYDANYPKNHLLVTGSARLDHYRKGGDALLGRYRYFRLHPFSISELGYHQEVLEILLQYGGFPEPLLKESDRIWRLWQKERAYRVVNDDIRSLENLRELSLMELLIEALPERVGSPLSLHNLSQDLQVSHETTRRWLTILDSVYLTYRLSPFGAPKIRAVKKEQKLYFWDWSQSPAGGIRFENMVAGHLLKYCHFLEDFEGYKMELQFVRDTDKREVDFIVLRDRKPLFLVECKTGEKQVSSNLRYFKERIRDNPPCYQVHLGKLDYGSAEKDVRVLPFIKFVELLKLP